MVRLKTVGICAVFAAFAISISYAILEDSNTRKAKDLLRNALESQNKLSYEATVVGTYAFHEGHTNVIRGKVTRARGRRQFQMLEMTRDGKPAAIVPREGPFASMPGHFPSFVKDVPLMLENYHVRMGPPREIAGRRSERLDVVSRHPNRSVYRFWIDRETFLITRREACGPDGKLKFASEIESVDFKELTLPPPQPSSHPWATGSFLHDATPEELAGLTFRPQDVPKLANGFQRKRHRIIKLEGPAPHVPRSGVVWSTYTDGIEYVNILQVQRKDLAVIDDLVKRHKLGMLWGILGHGRSTGNRSCPVARLDWDDVAVIATGSIGMDEIRMLLKRFLD